MAPTANVAYVAIASLVNVSTNTLEILMKVAAPNALAIQNVLPIVLVYALNAPILVPEHVVLKQFVPSTIIYQYVHVLVVTLVMLSNNVHQSL